MAPSHRPCCGLPNLRVLIAGFGEICVFSVAFCLGIQAVEKSCDLGLMALAGLRQEDHKL